MIIKMFNVWYFFWLALGIGGIIGLYFLLRHRSDRTKKIVLASILFFGIVMHFLKVLYPPYSTNHDRMLRDLWFVNICGANICLFPFFFLSKSDHAKDYMFYIGLLSGALALCWPLEPLRKGNQLAEQWDIVRFYYHHWELIAVPLLMVLLGLHKLNYRRVWFVPIYFFGVMMFIVVNQILQSELGFISLRGDDMTKIPYPNNSFIWGPGTDPLANVLRVLTPDFLKTIPTGAYAGQEKYWPILWLLFPMIVYIIPICFIISLIFGQWRDFGRDMKNVYLKCKNIFTHSRGQKA